MPPTLLLLSRSLETKEGEFAVEGGKHWRNIREASSLHDLSEYFFRVEPRCLRL